ncbi:hypothetical protein H1P_1500002 [Hyella patelloides LEGE 07179]|uniref:Uncharacterized protein n=1 Tax=Hyella patelloides LEGE 07179 TaxID=945734 RepID=A0A563VM55_9CYAN|nr:hypothetical protein [Hyella patelloides]VEP12502.1 hypothetical protein H1P_1500002 [Hyella patelloides LEGE 07179]
MKNAAALECQLSHIPLLGKHSDVWKTVLFARKVANLHILAWLLHDRCGMKDIRLKQLKRSGVAWHCAIAY